MNPVRHAVPVAIPVVFPVAIPGTESGWKFQEELEAHLALAKSKAEDGKGP